MSARSSFFLAILVSISATSFPAATAALRFQLGDRLLVFSDSCLQTPFDVLRALRLEGPREIEHGKHRENGEQVQRNRGDEPRPLSRDVAAGHVSGAPCEHRQGSPDLALEIEQALDEVLEEGAHRTVDMGFLPTGRTIGADERGSTIEATLLVGITVGLASPRFNRSRQQSAGHRIADCFNSVHQRPLPQH